MDSVDHKVLKTARQWHTDGRHVTLATITRSWGAASPSTGSMLAVRDDGQTMGSMSEGRVKHELIRHAHKTPPRSKVKVVECAGAVEAVLEPVSKVDWIDEILEAIERREMRVRWLDLPSGVSHVEEGRDGDQVTFNGQVMQTVHGPAGDSACP
jgi:xanthine dehydrogenase accessory factor